MKVLRILLLFVALFSATLCSATTVTKGQTVVFTVTVVKGTAPLKYRWYRNGTQIAGTTAPRLTLRNIRLVDSGIYTVKVFNAYGETLSPGQTLVVQR
jgi:Ig-like domain-containing protein